jgi:hypothetical protein
MKGAFPWLVRWTGLTRYFCPALSALVGPVQNIFLSPYTISSLSSSKLGRQPCWVACLLVCVSGMKRYQKTDNGLVIPFPLPRIPSNLGSRKNSACHRVQLSVHQGPVSEVGKYMRYTDQSGASL